MLLHRIGRPRNNESLILDRRDRGLEPGEFHLVVAAWPCEKGFDQEAQDEGDVFDRRFRRQEATGAEEVERGEGGVADQLEGVLDSGAVVGHVPGPVAGDEMREAFDVVPEGDGVLRGFGVRFIEGEELEEFASVIHKATMIAFGRRLCVRFYGHDSPPLPEIRSRKSRCIDTRPWHPDRASWLRSLGGPPSLDPCE